MFYIVYVLSILIDFNQKIVLNWFNMDTFTGRGISLYRNLCGLFATEGSLYVKGLQEHYNAGLGFSLDTFRLMAGGYWERIRTTGFGITEIDNIIIILLLIRLILLAIRYSIFTGFVITIASVVAGYLWYSSFLSALFNYENVLYKNSLTMRLAIDTNQMRRVMQAKIQTSDYQLRLTNPIGILLYALNTGSVYEGYRIDPISMLMAVFPKGFPKYEWVEGAYYLFYRKLIPLAIRGFLEFSAAFKGYTTYSFVTRVNKKYCPYLIRWHWTFIMIFKLFEPYYLFLFGRINSYAINVVYPAFLDGEDYELNFSHINFELAFLEYLCFGMVFMHLAFLLFGMLHALCGQYFYIPFFTENVELHTGERDKLSKYSGGYTAWQDEDENENTQIGPKLWYGWFGKGTRGNSDIISIIIKIVLFPFIMAWKLFNNSI